MLGNEDYPQKLAIVASYVGTSYCGWQKQRTTSEAKSKRSIQESIEQTIEKMTGEKVSVVGSGRTDAGVHSIWHPAHFQLRKKRWDPGILFKGLNSLLPDTIRILKIQEVPVQFHAQRNASRKQYSYYFQQGPCAFPTLLPYTWWAKRELDWQSMQNAAQFLKGSHDFKAFQAAGAAPVKTTVREIFEVSVSRESMQTPFINVNETPGYESLRAFNLVRFRIVGSGFLKQMVRSLAGTLYEIGEGRRPVDSIPELLKYPDRSKIGITAPAHGLWLERVWYPAEFDLD